MNETKLWRIGWRTRHASGSETVYADSMDEAIETAAERLGLPAFGVVSWTAQVVG